MAPGDLTTTFCAGKIEGAAKIPHLEGQAYDENRQEFDQFDTKGFYAYRRTRLRAFLLLVDSLPQELFTLLAQVNFDKWKAQYPRLYRHNRQAGDAMVPDRLHEIHSFYCERAERL